MSVKFEGNNVVEWYLSFRERALEKGCFLKVIIPGPIAVSRNLDGRQEDISEQDEDSLRRDLKQWCHGTYVQSEDYKTGKELRQQYLQKTRSTLESYKESLRKIERQEEEMKTEATRVQGEIDRVTRERNTSESEELRLLRLQVQQLKTRSGRVVRQTERAAAAMARKRLKTQAKKSSAQMDDDDGEDSDREGQEQNDDYDQGLMDGEDEILLAEASARDSLLKSLEDRHGLLLTKIFEASTRSSDTQKQIENYEEKIEIMCDRWNRLNSTAVNLLRSSLGEAYLHLTRKGAMDMIYASEIWEELKKVKTIDLQDDVQSLQQQVTALVGQATDLQSLSSSMKQLQSLFMRVEEIQSFMRKGGIIGMQYDYVDKLRIVKSILQTVDGMDSIKLDMLDAMQTGVTAKIYDNICRRIKALCDYACESGAKRVHSQTSKTATVTAFGTTSAAPSIASAAPSLGQRPGLKKGCSYWLKHGTCKFKGQPNQRCSGLLHEVCRYFEKGQCKMGKSCQRFHGRAQQQSASQSNGGSSLGAHAKSIRCVMCDSEHAGGPRCCICGEDSHDPKKCPTFASFLDTARDKRKRQERAGGGPRPMAAMMTIGGGGEETVEYPSGVTCLQPWRMKNRRRLTWWLKMKGDWNELEGLRRLLKQQRRQARLTATTILSFPDDTVFSRRMKWIESSGTFRGSSRSQGSYRLIRSNNPSFHRRRWSESSETSLVDEARTIMMKIVGSRRL